MAAVEVTDLPEPDSPTRATTSPGYTSRESPLTACTSENSVSKETERFSKLSAVPLSLAGVRGMLMRDASSFFVRRLVLRVWRGSNASRSPSPRKFTLSAMATMSMPGHQNSQGRLVNAFWYWLISRPSEDSGALTPKPRKLTARFPAGSPRRSRTSR